MLQIKLLQNRDILDAQNASSTYVHYMKSSMWASFKHETENYSYEFIGFYDDEKLCGTAMVLYNTWLTHRFAYIPAGPNIDYTNLELVTNVFNLLKDYADSKNVLFLRVDPNIERLHKDILGNEIDDGFSNEHITNKLIELGYTHKGYGYAYNGSWINRFTLYTDLTDDMETIFNRFDKTRKTSINRHLVNGIKTRVGSIDDIETLMTFESMLSSQEGFAPHSKQFFTSLLNDFKNNVVLFVTEVDFKQMVQGIEDELTSNKYKKDLEAKQAKEKELHFAQESLSKYGEIIPIAAGIFIYIGNKSWDLYTYNHKNFNNLKPVDNLHYFAMQYMKNHGVNTYDLCGFSGVTSKDDPYYGLYAYKKSFGARFVEHIGEFDYVRNESAMKRYRFEKLAINHLKRKYWAIRYKKD